MLSKTICEKHNRPYVLLKNGREFCPICDNPWFTDVWNLVHKHNQNVLIITEGPPGTGKSWIDLHIAESLDYTFNVNTIKERVMFHPKDFAKVVSDQKLKKGNAIMIEEGGIQADHRKWFSFNNMVINYILQTFRYQNLISIFNVPVIDYIDNDARKLFKYHLETVKIDSRNMQNIYKIKVQSYNSSTKKIYRKFLRYHVNGGWIKFIRWRTPRPSVKLCHAYEKMHKEFKHNLVQDLYRQMALIEKVEEGKKTRQLLDIDKAVEKVLANPDRYFNKYGTKWVCNMGLVEKDFNVGRAYGARIKNEAQIQYNEMKNTDNLTEAIR